MNLTAALILAGLPLPVHTVDELQTMDPAGSYVLAADLDLSGVAFMPIAGWSGSFDGAGHTISGLELDMGPFRAALFDTVLPGGTVHSLHLDGSLIRGGFDVGGIIGRRMPGSVVYDLLVTNTEVEGGGTYAAAVIGHNHVVAGAAETVSENLQAHGCTVTSQFYAGSVVGAQQARSSTWPTIYQLEIVFTELSAVWTIRKRIGPTQRLYST